MLSLAVAVGTAAACRQDTGVHPVRAAELAWREVPLPAGLAPVTLASSGPTLLVGARAAQRPVPRLLAGPTSADLHEVRLTPRSPYAFEATWFSIATKGDRVEAVGGARGGAHGNYRWSTWTGTTSGTGDLAEQEQPFGVFGSWGAGDLVGVAFSGDSPVILGAWQSERTGLDIATWLRSGDRWTRQRSTGTALGSTPTELVSAGAIASTGASAGDRDGDGGGGGDGDDDGLVLSGSVTRLGQGSVQVDPAVWTAPEPSGPWRRVDLPRPAGSATTEAHAASCRTGRCLVVGASGGRLVLWSLSGDDAQASDAVPEVALADDARALAPVSIASHDVVFAPGRERTLVVQSTGEGGEGWDVQDGPAGTPVAAVAHDDVLLLVTRDSSGATHLWQSHP